jgi:GDP-4-dehydro-6-deoxy-D-mannose reductase
MKILITGISGFVGSHLADFLLDKEHEVYGPIRWRSRTENIDHIKDGLRLIDCDLKDSHSVKKLIDASRPDVIFHLAAQSFVPTSWHAPQETLTNNVVSTVNIFEAVRDAGIEPIIQVAGTSEEYGLVHPEETPIKETNPLRPMSPYGVSKVATDMLCFQYNSSYGLKTILTRAFNHTGPRRGEVFVCSNFSKQIAEIEKGKQPVIRVGNLDASRDFTDVRDVVRAYWLATQRCTPGEVYNICSEKTWKIRDVLEKLISMTDKKIDIVQDPDRMRPSDVPVLLGDCSKFKKQTGWKPEIPFEKTLEDTLNYWRERI